ncbi:hypothetical protein CGRA01v4_14002 [Colletotrichum graminicola]|nr:hypothetical protein CGRA01v4_14002 [Colletotrichum graminicola]
MQAQEQKHSPSGSIEDQSECEAGSGDSGGTGEDKDPMEMINAGNDVHTHRFLVKYSALSTFVREIPGQPDGQDVIVPGLTTELRPWQLQAVRKISHLLRGPQKGAILGDEMGLGRTLAVAIAMQNRNGPYLGPALVVQPSLLFT